MHRCTTLVFNSLRIFLGVDDVHAIQANGSYIVNIATAIIVCLPHASCI